MEQLPKDLIIKLALELDLSELLSLCSSSKKINSTVCQNEIFWMNKLIKDFNIFKLPKNEIISARQRDYIIKNFGIEHLPKVVITYKDYYSYISKNLNNPDKLLDDAIQTYNDIDLTKFAIAKGGNIHRNSNYPLRYASLTGQLEIVKYLIEKGANVNASEGDALKSAGGKGYLNVVKYLVKHGANIHIKKEAALKWASYLGQFKVVKFLVENGADIHIKNDDPLNRAAMYGHDKIAIYLIKRGSDPKIAWRYGNEKINNYIKTKYQILNPPEVIATIKLK